MSNNKSGHPGAPPELHASTASSSAATLVTGHRGNMYGYLVENLNAGSDVFLQFYDAASAGAVTVGTGILYETRSPKGGAAGRDPVNLPLLNFRNGLVLAVSQGQGADVALTGTALVKVWYQLG